MTSHIIHDAYDVIVVGARCAGAATAMLLAALGLRVLVFDKGRYGSDTLSTHALMRPAVLLLKRWGIADRLEEEGTPRITKTGFYYRGGPGADSIDIDIRPRHGVDALYAPRRNVLDRALVDAARERGAEVHHGTQMLDLLRSNRGRVSGVVLRDPSGTVRRVHAGLVVGADGRRSKVASLVGSRPYVCGRHATSCAFGYFRNLPVDGNRWYYRPGVGAGAIPTNHGRTCIFAAVPRDFTQGSLKERNARFQRAISETAPDIAEAMPTAQLNGKLRFFPGMRGFVRQSWGDGWALVGDAGYMTDPVTAHGITSALRDADLLASTIGERASLADYQTKRDDLALKFFEISDRVAALDWDLPTVQQYHRMMSQEMNREEQAMVASAPEQRQMRVRTSERATAVA